jgi:hypothetical protein
MAQSDFRPTTERFQRAIGAVVAIIIGLSWSVDAFGAPSRSMQSPTATLSGTVVDEHDALVPDVRITVTNADTALQRKVITNGEGYFSVTLLPPGRYAYEGLDRVLHEKARLGMLTSLMAHPDGLLFSDLKELCALTDGNLTAGKRIAYGGGDAERRQRQRQRIKG